MLNSVKKVNNLLFCLIIFVCLCSIITKGFNFYPATIIGIEVVALIINNKNGRSKTN